jgi:hypothetical protein
MEDREDFNEEARKRLRFQLGAIVFIICLAMITLPLLSLAFLSPPAIILAFLVWSGGIRLLKSFKNYQNEKLEDETYAEYIVSVAKTRAKTLQDPDSSENVKKNMTTEDEKVWESLTESLHEKEENFDTIKIDELFWKKRQNKKKIVNDYDKLMNQTD